MNQLEVLVVEDATEYAQLVSSALRQAGHSVRVADTLAAARRMLEERKPDLVILDLMLPDGDGLDLCRQIREQLSAYVILLTGRDDEVDKIVGFRLGADDYVTKPFSPRELVARVEAMARRPREADTSGAERRHGSLLVRPLAREVELGGLPVQLTRIEFDLLDALTANPNQVLTRDRLLTVVWGADWVGDYHVVDVHIANLRRKLSDVDPVPVIRTVRGVGYSLAAVE